MDPKDNFREFSDLLTPLVEGTESAQLADDTPCDGFTVRDLIGHFTLGRFIFGAGLAGDDARQQELIATMPANSATYSGTTITRPIGKPPKRLTRPLRVSPTSTKT